eukprot:TRINITY_DN57972_c0_g1_i1.p1 TRINITY_DN57972_c0_g1~~TRINITY_DN57972_c0_g1_i1.p1  ORF type:complete len:108 (-),score=3.91 TRINITY_DN57972_c0_g1_i1:247-570(-)
MCASVLHCCTLRDRFLQPPKFAQRQAGGLNQSVQFLLVVLVPLHEGGVRVVPPQLGDGITHLLPHCKCLNSQLHPQVSRCQPHQLEPIDLVLTVRLEPPSPIVLEHP